MTEVPNFDVAIAMRRWRERERLEMESVALDERWAKAKESHESQGVRVVGELILQLSGMFGEDRNAFEERAAIIEYDGGFPCREAECLAYDLFNARQSQRGLPE